MFVVAGGATGCDLALGLTTPRGDAATPSSLLAWYPLDQLDGDSLSDASGNARHARCGTQCPTPVAGARSGAMYFDGTDLAMVENATGLATPAAFTVAMWIRIEEELPNPSCALSLTLGFTFGNSWQLCAPQRRLAVMFNTGTGAQWLSYDNLTLGAWHHVAVRWDGASRRLAIDGHDTKTDMTALASGMGQLVVGGDIDNGLPFALFRGSLDDVRIYSRVIADNELAELSTP
jgi:hypothetical protein